MPGAVNLGVPGLTSSMCDVVGVEWLLPCGSKRPPARAADAVTDLHGSAEYKAYLVGVLLRRAFEQAYQQAIGETPSDAARGRGTA